jgi:hypothetical protein
MAILHIIASGVMAMDSKDWHASWLSFNVRGMNDYR